MSDDANESLEPGLFRRTSTSFAAAPVAVKAVIIVSLVFIAVNTVFAVYAGTFLLHKGEDQARPNILVPIEPARKTDSRNGSWKSIQAQEYEKVFIEDYNEWSKVTNTLLYKINDRTKVETVWDDELGQQVLQMQALIERGRIIVPPGEYRIAHQDYLSAISEFGFTATNLEQAIETKDIDLLAKSMQKLIRGTSYLNRALNQIRQSR